MDPATVDVELNSAYPLLLNDLTNIFIFNKPWLLANNAMAPTDVGKGVEGYATQHTNGTGPFRLESRIPDQRTGTGRESGLVGQEAAQPRPDRVHADRLGRDPHRGRRLRTGGLHQRRAAPGQQRLENAPGVKLLLTTELRTVFFAFNLADKLQNGEPNPLRDERVRQAPTGAGHGRNAAQRHARAVADHRVAGRAGDPRLRAGSRPAAEVRSRWRQAAAGRGGRANRVHAHPGLLDG